MVTATLPVEALRAEVERDNSALPINGLETISVTAPPYKPGPPSRVGGPGKPPVYGGSEGVRERPGFIGNPGERVAVNDASDGDECSDGSDSSGANPTAANPIVLSTGNKVESEIDFASEGEMPLFLRRTYNHRWNYVGIFGKHWVSNFDYSLVWQPSGADPEGIIYAQRPDGRRIKFVRRAPGSNFWDEDKPEPVQYVQRFPQGGVFLWGLYNEDYGSEMYEGTGRVYKVMGPHGIGWQLAYSNSYLQSVTHTASGRSIQFTWTSNGSSRDVLTQVTAPNNQKLTYTYSANAFGPGVHRLANSKSPFTPGGDSANTITYHYEQVGFPGALTGSQSTGCVTRTSRTTPMVEHQERALPCQRQSLC